MKGTILITDSLFIFPEHEKVLRDAGYDIERLDKPEASEEELIAAVKGKVGYILAGIEKVTERIIDAADELKAIVFTGIGYKDFIPDWEYAIKKGIMIANTPDGPTHAVAEWSVTMALAMNRNIFELGRLGQKTFGTSKGVENQNIGIIGLGRIGKEISSLLKPFRPASISYYSQHSHADSEAALGIKYAEMNTVLQESDIVFVCVSKDAGKNFIDAGQLSLMKDGALLVTFMPEGIINEVALLNELKANRLRAVSDHPMKNPDAKNLPLSVWYSFNGSNAFNTETELKLVSDMAIKSMINLLETGEDENKAN